MNKCKKCKNSQKSLTGSGGDAWAKKGIVPAKKKEIPPHFSETPQTERTIFHVAASSERMGD